MKRYVCQVCLGKGKVETVEPNPDYDPKTIYSEEYNPATQNEFKIVWVPCYLCVSIGAPPFIEIPEAINQAQVDTLPKTEVEVASSGSVVIP